jgi:hypothetical protein
MTPDLPPAIEAAVRNAARQAVDAGAKHGRGAGAAVVGQVQAYAVNQVVHAWVAEAARQQIEGQHG